MTLLAVRHQKRFETSTKYRRDDIVYASKRETPASDIPRRPITNPLRLDSTYHSVWAFLQALPDLQASRRDRRRGRGDRVGFRGGNTGPSVVSVVEYRRSSVSLVAVNRAIGSSSPRFHLGTEDAGSSVN